MSGHTPGLLSLDKWRTVLDATGETFRVEGVSLPGRSSEETRENTRRLVACWNACEGSKTEDLELLGPDYIKPLIDLIDQRDEMLDALKKIAAYRPLTFAECSDAEAIIGIAENAIAKATNQQGNNHD